MASTNPALCVDNGLECYMLKVAYFYRFDCLLLPGEIVLLIALLTHFLTQFN